MDFELPLSRSDSFMIISAVISLTQHLLLHGNPDRYLMFLIAIAIGSLTLTLSGAAVSGGHPPPKFLFPLPPVSDLCLCLRVSTRS